MKCPGLLALAVLALLLLAGKVQARPDFVLTLRENGTVFVGMKYRTVSAQWALASNQYSVGRSKSEGYLFGTWPIINNYGLSLIKSFPQDGYETGIEALFGLVQLEHFTFNSAYGYHVAKEYGRIQLMIGPYVAIHYAEDQDRWDAQYVTTIRAFISMGVRIRI